MASVKRVISPEEWKNRQISTLKAVGRTNYLAGIASPKADPIARGIATEGKFADAMRKAIDDESRKKGLEKTDMGTWYKYAHDLGADKLVDGVVKREAKVSAFVTAFQPLLTSHLAKIDALAEETDSDRETRMLENLRGLKALKGKA
ncbi:MAG: hypothetical protein HWN68_20185 [Desulfobacterales bacterium]|nr:hypothetical protein [Desulfobacterales bacterium]